MAALKMRLQVNQKESRVKSRNTLPSLTGHIGMISDWSEKCCMKTIELAVRILDSRMTYGWNRSFANRKCLFE